MDGVCVRTLHGGTLHVLRSILDSLQSEGRRAAFQRVYEYGLFPLRQRATEGNFMTVEQVLRVYECFPVNVLAARLEVIIILFGRIFDLENFDLIYRRVTRLERKGLLRRLGWLNIFNPMKPVRPYVRLPLLRSWCVVVLACVV